MADIVEDIFSAGDKSWSTCAECKSASGTLTTLVGKYSVLKIHLEDVFRTKAVKVVFSPDEVHFTAATNTITLPHTTKAEDALDLVDAVVFESYNAIRKDQLNLSKSLSDVNYDLVASGKLTAEIEEARRDQRLLSARSRDGGERTDCKHEEMHPAGQGSHGLRRRSLSGLAPSKRSGQTRSATAGR